MKICLLGPTYPYRGGIAHYATWLCRELRRDHEVKFISFRRQFPLCIYPGGKTDKDPSREQLRVADVEYRLDTINPLTWPTTARAVARFDPDLLIVPWWIAHFAPAFGTVCRLVRRWSPRTEIVFWCHNVVDHESGRVKQMLSRWAFGLADRFLVHSEEDRANLVACLPGAQVAKRFLPTSADLSQGRFSKEESRRRLGLPPDVPVLLFFGYVRHYKGLADMLDAMALLKDRTNALLLVAGQFWKGQEIHLHKIAQHGLEDRVRVLNDYIPNEDIPLYFGACDLVVLPYLSATGSAVVQVAFGFDRPVVATRVGSLPEVVNDGVDGLLTAPHDPGAFADAVVRALEPETLGRLNANVRSARDRFSWTDLIDGLLERSPGGADAAMAAAPTVEGSADGTAGGEG